MIADIYGGGPVGVETLAAGLSEPRDTIEDVIEPYLLQAGLIARTARGRMLNASAWKHLGLNPPAGSQEGLFDNGKRSEEHTSELQSLMRISYAVFCLKKKNNNSTT